MLALQEEVRQALKSVLALPGLTADANGKALLIAVVDAAIDGFRANAPDLPKHRTAVRLLGGRHAVMKVFWDMKLYEHKCADCAYVGSSGNLDFYFHDRHIVARFGNMFQDVVAHMDYELKILPPNTEHLEAFLCVRELMQ